MSLTPLTDFSRPPDQHPSSLRANRTPPPIAAALDYLWSVRAVPWAGLPQTDMLALDDLWMRLADVRCQEDLALFIANARLLCWGLPDSWGKVVDADDVNQARARWRRGRLLLGEQALRFIATDAWRDRLLMPTSFEDIDHHTNAVVRERHANHPLHPSPVGGWSVAWLRQRASRLCVRFGIAHLRAAASMSLEDVGSALREAEVGMATMARVLGWNESEIGQGRLGLSFELAPSDAAGAYDPMTGTIDIARVGGWGGFAHEWAHAWDMHLANRWLPDATQHRAFASWWLENPQAGLPMLSQSDVIAWRSACSRCQPPASAEGLDVYTVILERLIGSLSALHDRLPVPQWSESFVDRLAALRVLAGLPADIVTMMSNSRRLDKSVLVTGRSAILTSWQKWRASALKVFSDRTDRRAMCWRDYWTSAVLAADHLITAAQPFITSQPPDDDQAVPCMAGLGAPGYPLWRQFSAARDELAAPDAQAYWNTPHEAFARAFSGMLRQRIGVDTWAAESSLNLDVEPCGEEMLSFAKVWSAVSPLARHAWMLTAPVYASS